jgi:hypothetical protein
MLAATAQLRKVGVCHTQSGPSWRPWSRRVPPTAADQERAATPSSAGGASPPRTAADSE